MRNLWNKFLIIAVSLLLSSCDGGGAPKSYSYALENTPLADIKEGETYTYTPKVSPLVTEKINFTISNKPEWILFDSDTGKISGIPSQADVGTHPDIEIQMTIGSTELTTAPFSITVEDINFSPIIGGIPETVAFYATRTYTFTPYASDQEGSPLEFFIDFSTLDATPDWISFDKNTGEISAQPEIEHIGDEYEITISVSDGTNRTDLKPFIFSVIPGIETATISWTPPTQNADGTVLEDLAGYNIYFGTTKGEYEKTITITLDTLNPTKPNEYTIAEDLLLPEYFFAMTAFDTFGNESEYSETVSKRVD